MILNDLSSRLARLTSHLCLWPGALCLAHIADSTEQGQEVSPTGSVLAHCVEAPWPAVLRLWPYSWARALWKKSPAEERTSWWAGCVTFPGSSLLPFSSCLLKLSLNWISHAVAGACEMPVCHGCPVLGTVRFHIPMLVLFSDGKAASHTPSLITWSDQGWGSIHQDEYGPVFLLSWA